MARQQTCCDSNKFLSIPSTVTRRMRDGTTTSIPCPQSVLQYNKCMGGVDCSDQLRGYYNARLKGRKCYTYIFWFLFDEAITNSYIVCKHHSTLQVLSTKEFRADLAKQLIGTHSSRKCLGRPSFTMVSPKPFSEDHFPVRGSLKSHRCTYCRTCMFSQGSVENNILIQWHKRSLFIQDQLNVRLT